MEEVKKMLDNFKPPSIELPPANLDMNQ